MKDYKFCEAEIIVKEMMYQLCLDMAAKKLVTESVSLFVGYSISQGVFGASGTVSFSTETNVASKIVAEVSKLYHRIVDPAFAIRRIGLSCNDVQEDRDEYQLNMFEDVTKQIRGKALQDAMLSIRAKYGKNSILKGVNFYDAATGRERNTQIGGHRGGKDEY
jgi:DNA polymerase V